MRFPGKFSDLGQMDGQSPPFARFLRQWFPVYVFRRVRVVIHFPLILMCLDLC
jgi:hypothetical protein